MRDEPDVQRVSVGGFGLEGRLEEFDVARHEGTRTGTTTRYRRHLEMVACTDLSSQRSTTWPRICPICSSRVKKLCREMSASTGAVVEES